MTSNNNVVLTTAGLCFLFAASTSIAQVEEVIVTARKREESILRVPVVATAITQEALEQYQTNDLYAMANRVPGILIGESVGTVGIQTSLRGVGPTSQSPSVDQSVSLNIDGLSLTQGYAYAAGMFDVGLVEVLKGPQSLFYGKNSTAGVLSLRSADPTNELEIVARGGYETAAEEKVGELILSGPATDALKLRLATRYSDMEGWFENTGTPIPNLGALPPQHRSFSPKESLIVRGTALFELNEIYSARLKLNYVDDRTEGNGGDSGIIYCPDGTGGVAPRNIAFLQDQDCKLDERVQLGDFDPAVWPSLRNGGVPFIDSVQFFGTLEQNIAVASGLTVTSVTGMYELEQNNLTRGSASSNPTIAPDFKFENSQLTQELRLTSDFDSPVNFMVGGYYQDGNFESQVPLYGNTAVGLPARLQDGSHEVDIRAISAFGQVLWQVTEQIEVAGGARWTDEEREHTLFNKLSNRFVNLGSPKISASNVSPEFSVTYTPSDNLTLFTAYRQGFKSGSFNTITVVSDGTRVDFDDEKAKGGEVGLKARLFDRALALNVAGYHYKYSGLQVGSNELSETGAIVLRTINAASAKVQGIDLDLVYVPTQMRNLSLNAAVNYNRARYTRFMNAPCGNGQTIAEGCNRLLNPATGRFTSQDLSGRPLVRAPDWMATFGVDYEMSLASDMKLALGAATRYSDEFYPNLIELDDYLQDDYFKTSASVSLKGANDAWEVALIVNNIGDKITASNCANSNTQNGSVLGGQLAGGLTKGPAGSDELTCVAERGREIWMRFTLRPLAF